MPVPLSGQVMEDRMDYKKLGLGLGVFSIALGALEVAAPGRIARALGLDENGPAKKTILAFGVRELAAGAMLLRSTPAPCFWRSAHRATRARSRGRWPLSAE
jgi:hypothetical protein